MHQYESCVISLPMKLNYAYFTTSAMVMAASRLVNYSKWAEIQSSTKFQLHSSVTDDYSVFSGIWMQYARQKISSHINAWVYVLSRHHVTQKVFLSEIVYSKSKPHVLQLWEGWFFGWLLRAGWKRNLIRWWRSFASRWVTCCWNSTKYGEEIRGFYKWAEARNECMQ